MYFRKLREQKENERQSRIRLGKRLDALRPTTSVKGKQPAAEETSTVFDVVSFELKYNRTLFRRPPIFQVFLTVSK